MLAAVVVSFFTSQLPFRAFTLFVVLVPEKTLGRMLSSNEGEPLEMIYRETLFCTLTR